MKKFEILIADTRRTKLTVATDRITIKTREPKVEEIEFLKRVAAKLENVPVTMRGNIFCNGIIMSSDTEDRYFSMNDI